MGPSGHSSRRDGEGSSEEAHQASNTPTPPLEELALKQISDCFPSRSKAEIDDSSPKTLESGATKGFVKVEFDLKSEEISLGNLREAIDIGCAAFEKPEDQSVLKLAYRLYSIGLKTIPEKIFGKFGLTSMKAYQVWRDDSNGKAVAVSGLYTLGRTPGAAWLGWFGVIPSARCGGLGSQIVGEIEQMAKQRGYESMMLYHSADDSKLVRFYEKLGYKHQKNSVAYGEEVTIRKKVLTD